MKHVALLRGINVGPSSRISMADLRELFSELGFTNVRTHLQSGNVIFSSTSAVDVAALERAIATRFSYKSRVVVVSADRFIEIARENPLLEFVDDPSKMVITFVESLPDLADVMPDASKLAPEQLRVGAHAVYQWCPNGILKSTLSPAFFKALGPTATTRNLRTVDKIVDLLEG